MKCLYSLFTVAILCFPFLSQSQQMVLNDPVSNSYFSSTKYAGIKGSPFLFEDLKKGEVTTEKGIYKNLELKFDIYENALYFKNKDQMLAFADKITGFEIISENVAHKFRNGFNSKLFKPETFVEVLVEQNDFLLVKSTVINITEINEINAGLIKTFKQTDRYLVKTPGSDDFKMVKLNAKELESIFPEKAKAIQNYIKSEKINIRNENGFVRAFQFAIQ